MQTAEIKKMTTVERLRSMEALWDALIHEDGEPYGLRDVHKKLMRITATKIAVCCPVIPACP